MAGFNFVFCFSRIEPYFHDLLLINLLPVVVALNEKAIADVGRWVKVSRWGMQGVGTESTP